MKPNQFAARQPLSKTLSLSALALMAGAAPSVWAGCDYTVTNSWNGGFTAQITLKNDTAATINTWSLQWSEANATISNSWNATLSGSNPYTATPLGWNASVAPGASVSFGLQANGTPSAPKLNGVLCGAATPSSAAISSARISSAGVSSVSVSSRASSQVASVIASSRSSAAQSSAAISSASVATEGWVFEEASVGFCTDQALVKDNHPDYTYVGFVDTLNQVGATAAWSLDAARAQTYKVTYRFANAGGANRPVTLLVNGQAVQTLTFGQTDGWAGWQTLSANVAFKAGVNRIALTAESAGGLPNIDHMHITGAAITPAACTAASASSQSSQVISSSSAASSSVAAVGRMLTLDGNPAANWVNRSRTKWNASRADVVLSYQQTNGGWPKNLDYNSASKSNGGNESGTIDNGATITEMVYLAEVYKATGNIVYRDAVRKAANFLLSSQYASGALPQYFPLRGGYSNHATFNDNGMAYALTVLDFAANQRVPFTGDIFNDNDRNKFKAAVNKGTDFIVRAQWKQNGKLTAWCAQHGATDYQPKAARAYELASLSGSESVGVTAFLLTQPQTPAVEAAARAALNWFNSPSTYLEGYTYDSSKSSTNPIVQKAGSKMWYRFYDLNTNRGFFSDRDGSKFYDITQMSLERRTGYSWGGDYGSGIINFGKKVGYL